MLTTKMSRLGDVVICDINENCLNFQKYLFSNLDTLKTVDQYESLVQTFKETNNVDIEGQLYNRNQIQQILNDVQDKLEFIKSLSVHYHKCDLRLPDEYIRNKLKINYRPLVYFSNIFSYAPTLENNTSEKHFVLFLNILLGCNLHVLWHGDTYERYNSSNFINQSNEVYFQKLNIQLPFQSFLEEIAELEKNNLFTEHRTKDGYKDVYYNHGWSSFVIHGLGFDKTQGFEQYGYKNDKESPYAYTKEALEHCPEIVQWFKEKKFKDRYHRVRIMKLAAGGIVGLHNDNDNPTACATNMAVNNPTGCEMHFLNRNYQHLGIVPWQSGDVYRIFIGLNHYVINKSKEDRYHFIIHGEGGTV
jgi:hypothetical protein